MHTDDTKPKRLQTFAGDDGKRRGRRPSKVASTAPFDLAADDKLMAGLDPQGWYRELATRQRRAFVVAHYGPENGLERSNDDPEEMDRLMCRTEPVAKVETPLDLKVAQFNGRLVLEVDPDCLEDVLFQKIKGLLKDARKEKIEDLLNAARKEKKKIEYWLTDAHTDPAELANLLKEKEKIEEEIEDLLEAAREEKRKPNRHISFEAWANHRILSLYDLVLMGYDLEGQRKQLAKWLFPEIADQKTRGDKYDRARELLAEALAALKTLRAWAER